MPPHPSSISPTNTFIGVFIVYSREGYILVQSIINPFPKIGLESYFAGNELLSNLLKFVFVLLKAVVVQKIQPRDYKIGINVSLNRALSESGVFRPSMKLSLGIVNLDFINKTIPNNHHMLPGDVH
jgi:hypothetical protein